MLAQLSGGCEAELLLRELPLIGIASSLLDARKTCAELLAEALFDYVIPSAAGLAVFCSVILVVRHFVHALERACSRNERQPRFGRKGLIVSVASLLFAISCFYRSLFVADEGAALCRGVPSVFNAPASGRSVATVGEIALVVQISTYIDDTARRLGVHQGLCASCRRFAYAPVLVAECLSWSGVITGVSKFYCCEYVLWILIASTWIWDSSELLHKSRSWGDAAGHALLLTAGVGLVLFNALFEIPHFFSHQRADAQLEQIGALSMCFQDPHSPIWLKRLPFFVTYFFGCSWCSVGVSYRYLRKCRSTASTEFIEVTELGERAT